MFVEERLDFGTVIEDKGRDSRVMGVGGVEIAIEEASCVLFERCRKEEQETGGILWHQLGLMIGLCDRDVDGMRSVWSLTGGGRVVPKETREKGVVLIGKEGGDGAKLELYLSKIDGCGGWHLDREVALEEETCRLPDEIETCDV